MLFVRAGPALHGPALHGPALLGPTLYGRLQSPECLPLHVLLSNAMILQRLVPHRVPGVAQGLCTKLVGLEPQETDRQTDRHLSAEPTWSPSFNAPLSEKAWVRLLETDMTYSRNDAVR